MSARVASAARQRAFTRLARLRDARLPSADGIMGMAGCARPPATRVGPRAVCGALCACGAVGWRWPVAGGLGPGGRWGRGGTRTRHVGVTTRLWREEGLVGILGAA